MDSPERDPARTSAPETDPASPSSDFDAERRWVRRANRGADSTLEDDLSADLEQQEQEQRQLHRAIPRVKPRTTEELDVEPPPKQRYPVHIGRALRQLWQAREVMFTLVERDLRVRYKQAVLGAFWAVAQPLMLMVIFTVVFGKIAKVGSEGLPYPIFSYVALVPWGLYSGSISYATGSIIGNSAIVRKIAIPREIFPISSVMSSGFDYLVSLVILFGMLTFYGLSGDRCANCLPHVTWVAFPVLLAVLLMFMTAVTLVVSAVTVYYRDTRYGLPMLLQIWLYATPVAYPVEKMIGPSGVLHGTIAKLYPYLNPLAPIMDGFRRILAHGTWPQWGPVGSAAIVSAAGLALSYWWYKRIDRTFADVI